MSSSYNYSDDDKKIGFENYNSLKSRELLTSEGASIISDGIGKFSNLAQIIENDEVYSRHSETFERLFPRYIRSRVQLLLDFLEQYYKSPDQIEVQNLFNTLIYRREIDFINTSDQEHLNQFFKEFAVSFAKRKDFNLDIRTFLKHIRTFYLTKGSRQSFEIFFKVVFGVDCSVFYPWEYVLHTDEGEWIQERFITVSHSLEEDDWNNIEFFYFYFENNVSPAYFEIARVQHLSSTVTRIFTLLPIGEGISLGQQVRLADIAKNDYAITFLEKSLKKIQVLYPGQNWQLGQTIEFPADSKNTIARVDRLYPQRNYGIAELEIIDFGYPHEKEETRYISPYAYEPPIQEFSLESGYGNRSPIGIDFTTIFNEKLNPVDDEVIGYEVSTYFLEDYDLTSESGNDISPVLDGVPNYSGDIAFYTLTENVSTTYTLDTGLSLEEWEASLAHVQLILGTHSTLPGYWKTHRSKISDKLIRLQDNWYYQLFSYVVRTDIDPEQYKDSIDIMHPSGHKRFLQYELENPIVTDANLTTDVYVDGELNITEFLISIEGSYIVQETGAPIKTY